MDRLLESNNPEQGFQSLTLLNINVAPERIPWQRIILLNLENFSKFTTEQKRKSGCGSKHNFKLELI